MLQRKTRLSLDERRTALEEAIATAESRVPSELLTEPKAILQRADERRARGDQAVVVALVGGTGTGKSSLFNALADQPLADVDVRRPTTDAATAWSVGDPGEMAPLLDWLEIEPVRRHLAPSGATPEGLVLLDLPDMDSVAAANRTTADRLLERVDVLVWVVDPHKYAQRSLHEGYLARLREHAEIMVVALNKVDRLDAADKRTVQGDLRRLVGGRSGPGVMSTSVVTGEGLDKLRGFITSEVAERRAVAARIAADVRTAAAGLLQELEPPAHSERGGRDGASRPGSPPAALDPAELTEGLVGLAGVEQFAERARGAYVIAARRAIRTPLLVVLRIVAGVLRSLVAGLGFLGRIANLQRREGGVAASRSDPAPAQLDVRHALLGLSEAARHDLPWFWAERISGAADHAGTALPSTLKSALADVPLQPSRRRWWTPATVVWVLAEVAAAAGIVWIVVLPLVTLWLQLPPVPEVTVGNGLSVPGLLVAGGSALWAVVAVLRRFAVRAGARRHRRSVGDRAREAVHEAVRETAIAPLQREIDAYERTRRQLSLAAS